MWSQKYIVEVVLLALLSLLYPAEFVLVSVSMTLSLCSSSHVADPMIVSVSMILSLCSPLYVADSMIVLVALFLELFLHFMDEDEFSALSGLLIFARSWRFIRIAHGLATTVHTMHSFPGTQIRSSVHYHGI